MNVLGINYIFHDSAACLFKDGSIAHAVEEERLTRHKHTQEFPTAAIQNCLSCTNTNVDEIDYIAISFNPGKSEEHKLSYAAMLGNKKGPYLDYEFERLKNRTLQFWSWYHSVWPEADMHKPKVHFIDHHDAHVIGTYLVSPWESAALMSIDGWGEWSTTWIGKANGNKVEKYSESYFPHSLGVFYSAATEFCGFQPNYDEGKTMGLASTGNPMRFFDIVDSMVQVSDNGEVTIDTSWFDFPTLVGRLVSNRFIDQFGNPRKKNFPLTDIHRDVAAAFQAVIEKNILKIARFLRLKTQERYLVLAGGVALNSVANGLIVRNGIFDDVFIMPGAGDNGTAIGAAACVHNMFSEIPVHHTTPYLGSEYKEDTIRHILDEAKVKYRRSSDVIAETAKALSENKIVGWFQGRMEFGPRSLGARSILANPTHPDMKRKINSEVKHRESFRPFAPAILVERAKDYFDINVPVPYMLKVAPVRHEMVDKIPAVVHVDGTARLQTVDSLTNPSFYKLIEELAHYTNHPVVLNTSFNVMGEPIVESPIDALRCFFSTGLDFLALGPFVITKS